MTSDGEAGDREPAGLGQLAGGDEAGRGADERVDEGPERQREGAVEQHVVDQPVELPHDGQGTRRRRRTTRPRRPAHAPGRRRAQGPGARVQLRGPASCAVCVSCCASRGRRSGWRAWRSGRARREPSWPWPASAWRPGPSSWRSSSWERGRLAVTGFSSTASIVALVLSAASSTLVLGLGRDLGGAVAAVFCAIEVTSLEASTTVSAVSSRTSSRVSSTASTARSARRTTRRKPGWRRSSSTTSAPRSASVSMVATAWVRAVSTSVDDGARQRPRGGPATARRGAGVVRGR